MIYMYIIDIYDSRISAYIYMHAWYMYVLICVYMHQDGTIYNYIFTCIHIMQYNLTIYIYIISYKYKKYIYMYIHMYIYIYIIYNNICLDIIYIQSQHL